MRPSVQHFLWQWVILHENEKSLPYQRLSPRFDIEAQGNSEIAYSFWSRRHWQITLFCDNRGPIIVLTFDRQICFFNIFGKRSDLPFFKQDRSQEGENRGFLYAWAEYYLYRGYRSFVYRVRQEASLAGGRHVFDANWKPCMKSLWQPGYIFCKGQTPLDDIAREQTIICGQLFVGHVVGFRPMKRRKICIQW